MIRNFIKKSCQISNTTIKIKKNTQIYNTNLFKFSNQTITPQQKYIEDEEDREWFFYIDHKGLLYLEEVEPKNFTSCIKDARFMKNFYKNLKRNDTGKQEKYPYLSMCWGEFNFVKSAYYPILYSSGLEMKFDPSNIRIDQDGLLFHLVDINDLQYGIFSSDLSVSLSEKLIEENGQFKLNWNDQIYQLQQIQTNIDHRS